MITKPSCAVLRRDMWNFIGQVEAVCITTNGFVKANGRAVMGRGCAAEARRRFPTVDAILGSTIKLEGNSVAILFPDVSEPGVPKVCKTALVAFPTKDAHAKLQDPGDLDAVLPEYRDKVQLGQDVPGWMLTSSLGLIDKSCRELRVLADQHNWQSVVLPMPGVGNGGLDWAQVEPSVEKHLDTRFIIVHR